MYCRSHSMRPDHWILTMLAALAMFAPVAVRAQVTLGPVEFHGYGDLTAVHADDGDGWESGHDISLVATTNLGAKTKLWAQAAHLSDTGLHLDWAFVDVTLTPVSTLRLGQIRLPFGTGNEVRDVQALRTAAELPLMYSDDLGIIDESFRGAALERRTTTAGGTDVTLEGFFALKMVPDAGKAQSGRVGGARIMAMPANSAWSYQASLYIGHVEPVAAPAGSPWEDKYAVAAGAQRRWSQWKLSVEAGAARVRGTDYLPVYVEIEHRWGPTWAGFLRADVTSAKTDLGSTTHTHLSAGAAWKPSSYWGTRLQINEHHQHNDTALNVASGSEFEAILSVNFDF